MAPWLLGLALLLAQAAGGQIIAYEGTGQLAASRGSNATVLSVRGGEAPPLPLRTASMAVSRGLCCPD